jgi:hypothetical protein
MSVSVKFGALSPGWRFTAPAGTARKEIRIAIPNTRENVLIHPDDCIMPPPDKVA